MFPNASGFHPRCFPGTIRTIGICARVRYTPSWMHQVSSSFRFMNGVPKRTRKDGASEVKDVSAEERAAEGSKQSYRMSLVHPVPVGIQQVRDGCLLNMCTLQWGEATKSYDVARTPVSDTTQAVIMTGAFTPGSIAGVMLTVRLVLFLTSYKPKWGPPWRLRCYTRPPSRHSESRRNYVLTLRIVHVINDAQSGHFHVKLVLCDTHVRNLSILRVFCDA